MKKLFFSLTILVVMLLTANVVNACTNYLITKGASTDGSTMISYAADSHVLYGELYHWSAAHYPVGTMLDVYNWDSGKYLGQIAQAEQTWNVVGNMNEWQVAIGETTYGGRHELVDTTGIIDYGSLIYITLQRAKTAREAIHIIGDLLATYGYASSGESFSISDPNEVWILELIGKGTKLSTKKKTKGENLNKGAVWVARMVPDGYVCAHANQARITTFPLADGVNSITFDDIDKIENKSVQTVYASDVISFAREMGWFKGKDKNFSFSDTYAPVDFGGARFCEIRVWSMFNDVAPGMDNYWEYVKGNIVHGATLANGDENVNGYATNRMPLWIKPAKKVALRDMFHFMRNHLEGTELDMSKDVGAGPFGNPYRWRPLTWKVDDVAYCNERATATQQTGFSFIAQGRSWLPREIGGIIWFGVDDASSSVYCPMYSSITEVPYTFEVGNGSIMEWSGTSAFWIFNQMTNFAYTRYNLIHPEIAAKQAEYESMYLDLVEMTDIKAQKMLRANKEDAVAYLTRFSCEQGVSLAMNWNNFYHNMFVKYMDGNIKTKREVPKGYKYVAPKVEQPGYGEETYELIIEKTGDQFKVKGAAH